MANVGERGHHSTPGNLVKPKRKKVTQSCGFYACGYPYKRGVKKNLQTGSDGGAIKSEDRVPKSEKNPNEKVTGAPSVRLNKSVARFVGWSVNLGVRKEIGLIPLLSVLLLVSSCGRGYRDYQLDRTSFDVETLRMIQSDTGITLPAGARGLNFYYKAPIDPAYAAKIEIPRSSGENMIQTLSAIKNEEIHVSGALGAKMAWWIPKGAKVLVDRQATVGVSGHYLHVTLTQEGDSVILYIEWAHA